MSKFDKKKSYVELIPDGDEYYITMGEKSKPPVFYVKKDGTTPLGNANGNTFASLTDTPNDIDKNLGKVLGSIGKKIGFLQNAVFDNLEAEKLEANNLKVEGSLDCFSMKCVNNVNTKSINVDDLVQSERLNTKEIKSKELVTEISTTKYSKVEDLQVNHIDAKMIKTDKIELPFETIGTFELPIMISKAEFNKFDISKNRLVIVGTYPKNQAIVSFKVKTDYLLKNKIVNVIVNDLYGDVNIFEQGKLIKISEPNEFTVMLKLNEHSGNSIIKIDISII